MHDLEKKNVKTLVVGAGGIGCELLKNLVLSGYENIQVIDLDTIDVSNLNRQFLFRKKHVGQPKAKIASEAVKVFNPNVNIVYHHKSIFSTCFDNEFFQSFDVVFNALDNLAARKHVNRICIHNKIPLIESGTAGYLGQVEPLLAVEETSPCFECQERDTERRTYPTCTIRNTPSEPIHCVIWSKFLFTHLFGQPEEDDEDVTPDMDDPALEQAENNNNGVTNGNGHSNEQEKVKDFWLWAETASLVEHGQPSEQIAFKLWAQDIHKLCSMRKLWEGRKDRTEPTPIEMQALEQSRLSELFQQKDHPQLVDQRLGSLADWLWLFCDSARRLHAKPRPQVWDKDDKDAMEFVAASSILRAMIFHIPAACNLNIFAIKSMAGNIIPAIATTNAVVAGLMVLQGDLVLAKQYNKLRTVYLYNKPGGMRSQIIAPTSVQEKNPDCPACAPRTRPPEYTLFVHGDTTLKHLKEEILIRRLGMIAPDVEKGDKIVLSSEDDADADAYLHKTLAQMGITHGVTLNCDDFRQDFTLLLKVLYVKHLKEEVRKMLQLANVNPQITLVGEASFQALPDDAKLAVVRTSSGRVVEKRKLEAEADDEEAQCCVGDDDDLIIMPISKKPRLNENGDKADI